MSREKGGVLTVNEAFDRAWRRVGLALDRIGFTVEDRDRSQGIYFVRYINPDADNKTGGGLLSKLLFWRDENADSADQYRVQLSEAGAATEVKVLNKDGTADKIKLNHTYNEQQIEWFKAGSALNLIRKQFGKV